ncbi:MAG: peptidoglycan-binding protein [Boseongicola sp.]
MKLLNLAAALSLILAVPTFASDVALIIGNEDYRGLPDVRRGDDVTTARRGLERQNVSAVIGRDATVAQIREAMLSFSKIAPNADRLLIVLSGRFVKSPTETYFLPSNIGAPSLGTASRNGLPMSVVLAYLSATPGQSILALATDATQASFGPLLQLGIGELDLPQGVTLLRADPQRMARFLSSTLVQPGNAIKDSAAKSGVTVSGFLSKGQSFLPVPTEPVAAPAPSAPAKPENRLRDLLAWREASRVDTVEAYQNYVRKFPGGQFARMAENRIKAAVDTPEARAERAEQALDLNRSQRREIQRSLSLLEFNTRGIDGIFGRGTRAAIGAWQEANSFEKTGFLTRQQITRLSEQAERRAAALEAEAERRRQDQLARDRAFWAETGAVGDEAGYRVYLDRFPDGEFSDLARVRLDDIERRNRAETDARDRQLWDEASLENTIGAYQDYLALAPGGAFRDEAAQRIAALERKESEESQHGNAKRQEQALNLNNSTRQVVESRLKRLGLKPGRVDGKFDENTRRAIRRYQQARNMPQTGYLNETVIVRLLADSIFR